MGEGHRAGSFKRPAKSHKSWKGHRTKGQIDEQNRGRVAERDQKIHRSSHRSQSRVDRMSETAQKRSQKTKVALEERRKYLGADAPPTLATVIVFGGAVDKHEFVNKLQQCDETIQRSEGRNVTYFAVPRFKARLGFLLPEITNIDEVLECLKVSDVVCFVWPLEGSLSTWEELIVGAVKAHGLPTYINVVPGLGAIQSGKKKDEARKAVVNLISQWSLMKDKLYNSSNVTDGFQIIRAILETKKNRLLLQQRRSHLLVEELEVSDEKDGVCTLSATGYIRGPNFNVNHLVHLPGWGDFQVSSVKSHVDPHVLKAKPNSSEVTELAKADPEKQQSLQSEIVPDPMDAEQTWPDEHDVVAEEDLLEKGNMKKVPKGTSAYQAAWILESDEEGSEGENAEKDDGEDDDNDDDDDDDDEDADIDMEGLEPTKEEEEEEREELNMDDAMTEAGTEFMDDEIDMDEVEKYRKEREDMQFPDEVDTPIEIPARIRFQKYRGMKSFRTSRWDALENLPYDYARIFKFKNFKKTRKTVMSEIDPIDGVIFGQYVTIQIEGVPVTMKEEISSFPYLILYQLLPHEQKMSVLNMVIKRHPTCTIPIMGKTKLIFQVGFRKFEAEPVFSQHTNGDKFKMERFLPQNGNCVASVFAPITFPPSSVLVFRKDAKGRQELVASGSILDNNPDRIILKRVVLSGHPFKINKRSVVCRYMFFNKEDIDWFKPVELYTPSGRRGHIKESIGTHGHMKCRFDQQLNAQDAVMMSLYKRSFPKWTYNPRVERMGASRLVDVTEDVDMSEE